MEHSQHPNMGVHAVNFRLLVITFTMGTSDCSKKRLTRCASKPKHAQRSAWSSRSLLENPPPSPDYHHSTWCISVLCVCVDETATIPSRDVAGLALLLTNPYLRERRCGLKLLVRARDFVSTPLVQV